MEFTPDPELGKDAADLWPDRDVVRFTLSGGGNKVTGPAVLDLGGLPWLSLYIKREGGGLLDKIFRPWTRDGFYLAFYQQAGEDSVWFLKDMATSAMLRLVRKP